MSTTGTILVELQEWMGSDESIANAAWTSTYDKDKREDKYDDKERVSALVRRLILDGHGTPVESVVLRFWIRMPIFVDRQHMTHRIACLSMDDELYFDLPKTGKQKTKSFKMKLRDFVRKWQNGVESKTRWGGVTWKNHRSRLKKMKLRCVNEETKEIEHTTVSNIFDKGMQPVFEISFSDGYRIKSTLNHRFWTESGWKTIGEALGLEENLRETPRFFQNSVRFLVRILNP